MRRVLKKCVIYVTLIIILFSLNKVHAYADSNNKTELNVRYQFEFDSVDLGVKEEFFNVNNLNTPNIVRRIPKLNNYKISINRVRVTCENRDKEKPRDKFNLYNWNGDNYRYDLIEKENYYELSMIFKDYKSIDTIEIEYKILMPFIKAKDVAYIEVNPYDNNLNDIKVKTLRVSIWKEIGELKCLSYLVKGENIAKSENGSYDSDIHYLLNDDTKVEMAMTYDANAQMLKNYPIESSEEKRSFLKNKYREEIDATKIKVEDKNSFQFDDFDFEEGIKIAKIVGAILVIIVGIIVKCVKDSKNKKSTVNSGPNYYKEDINNKKKEEKIYEEPVKEKQKVVVEGKNIYENKQPKDNSQQKVNICEIPSQIPPAYLSCALRTGREAMFLSIIFDFIRRELISIVEVNGYGNKIYKLKINDSNDELLEYENELMKKLKDIEGLASFNLGDIGNFFKTAYFDDVLSICEDNFKLYVKNIVGDECGETLYNDEVLALKKWKMYKDDIIRANSDDMIIVPITTLEKVHIYSIALGLSSKEFSSKIPNDILPLSQYLDSIINKREEKTNMRIESYIFYMVKQR